MMDDVVSQKSSTGTGSKPNATGMMVERLDRDYRAILRLLPSERRCQGSGVGGGGRPQGVAAAKSASL